MSASQPRERSKFGSIEIARGLAAAVVVLHHTGNIMAEPRFFGDNPFSGHLKNFNVGVDFFFVLSGFIIAWIHWSDLGKIKSLGSYAKKRFLRIYPPYWGILAFLIALYALVPSAGKPSQHDPWNTLLSIVLLPYPDQPILGVAWTLTHEIFFYAIFGLIIAVGRRGLWIMPIWAVSILVWNTSKAGEIATDVSFYADYFPATFFLSPFNLEFIMGVGAAGWLQHRRVPAPKLLLFVGAFSFLAMMIFAVDIQDNPLIGRLAFGLSATLFVLGAVELERTTHLALPGPLALFGLSSYSVYLVHTVVLSFATQVLTRLGGRALPLEVAAIILFVIAMIGGILYFMTAEKILTRLVRSLLPASRKTESSAG